MAKGKNLKQKLQTLKDWAQEKGLPKKPHIVTGKVTERTAYVPGPNPIGAGYKADNPVF